MLFSVISAMYAKGGFALSLRNMFYMSGQMGPGRKRMFEVADAMFSQQMQYLMLESGTQMLLSVALVEPAANRLVKYLKYDLFMLYIIEDSTVFLMTQVNVWQEFTGVRFHSILTGTNTTWGDRAEGIKAFA